jgi:hypothetical protein
MSGVLSLVGGSTRMSGVANAECGLITVLLPLSIPNWTDWAGTPSTSLQRSPGLLATGLPLGIIPLGTANDLARTLGIPDDLQGAAAVIAGGKVRWIDLGEVRTEDLDVRFHQQVRARARVALESLNPRQSPEGPHLVHSIDNPDGGWPCARS